MPQPGMVLSVCMRFFCMALLFGMLMHPTQAEARMVDLFVESASSITASVLDMFRSAKDGFLELFRTSEDASIPEPTPKNPTSGISGQAPEPSPPEPLPTPPSVGTPTGLRRTSEQGVGASLQAPYSPTIVPRITILEKQVSDLQRFYNALPTSAGITLQGSPNNESQLSSFKQQLQELDKRLLAQETTPRTIVSGGGGGGTTIVNQSEISRSEFDALRNMLNLTQKIDKLDGVTITNATISGYVQNSSLTSYLSLGGGTLTGSLNASSTVHISGALTLGGLFTSQTTSTSTFAGGLSVSSGGINVALPSCNSGSALTTDSSGAIVCGVISPTTGGGWTDDGTTVRLTTATDSVGIGTTSPAQKLSVNGRIQFDSPEIRYASSSASALTFKYNAAATSTIVAGGGAFNIATSTATGLKPIFSVNGTTGGVNLSHGLIVSGGNVGIGTAAPASKLEIGSGQITVPNGTASMPSYAFSTSPTSGFYIDVDGLKVSHNGTITFDFRSGANYAHKSFYPAVDNSLQVGQFTSRWARIYGVLMNSSLGSASAPAYQFDTGDGNGSNGGIFFTGTYNSNSIGLTTSGVERMRIDSSGNVGIGTTSPAQKLSVNGRIQFDSPEIRYASSSASALTFKYNAAATSTIVAGGGAFNIATSTATGLKPIFSVNGTTGGVNLSHGLIVSGGNVGIGTAAPADKLHVNGILRVAHTVSGDVLKIYAANGNPELFYDNSGYNAQFKYYGGSGFMLGRLSYNSTLGWHAESTYSGNPSFGVIANSTDANDSTKTVFRVTDQTYTTPWLNVVGGGNVGIGTTSPLSKLAITGSVNIWNAGTQADLNVNNGAICADNNDLEVCYGRTLTAGVVYGDSSSFAAADVAEMYDVVEGEELQAGDVVAIANFQFSISNFQINSNDPNANTKTVPHIKKAEPGDTIIGIVSTEPGVLLNDDPTKASSSAPVALVGRVPVKINLDGGDITPGDAIALSSKTGIAMKATSSGMIIGYALEAFNGKIASSFRSTGTSRNDSREDTILVFVNLGYAKLDPQIAGGELSAEGWIVDKESGRITTSLTLDMAGRDIMNVRNILGIDNKWSIDEGGALKVISIEADKIKTDEICVGEICVTEKEFKNVFGAPSAIPTPSKTPEPEPKQSDIPESEPKQEAEEPARQDPPGVAGGPEPKPSEEPTPKSPEGTSGQAPESPTEGETSGVPPKEQSDSSGQEPKVDESKPEAEPQPEPSKEEEKQEPPQEDPEPTTAGDRE